MSLEIYSPWHGESHRNRLGTPTTRLTVNGGIFYRIELYDVI